MDISLKQKQVIDFIVNDAAFKLKKGMTRKPADKCDLFIDTSLFKLKMLSFIFWIDNDGIEAHVYDYKPDDETLNYFINLSKEDRSVIEQRILNKIKGIEVSSTDETEWVDAVWPQDHGKLARFWPNSLHEDKAIPDHSLWNLGTLVGYSADRYRPWIMDFDGKISCQMYCQVKKKVEPVVKQSLTPELPEGYRWLKLGEIILCGDRYFDEQWKDHSWAIGEQYGTNHLPTIRRSEFNIGEKVMHINDRVNVYEISGYDHYKNLYWIVYKGNNYYYTPFYLAPYIEEKK